MDYIILLYNVYSVHCLYLDSIILHIDACTDLRVQGEERGV